MNELARLLAERIRTTGPLSVAQFMEQALLHPRLGYYTTRDPLGARGDFTTAPEVSQIFGELIGLWCADAWDKMGRPGRVILAELGPGRGTLMADALRALSAVPELGRALDLRLVEASPVLRRAQAAMLAAASPTWHARLADLPEGPLLLIANEFLDALPVHQLVRGADAWHERLVTLGVDGQSLAFTVAEEPSAVAALLPTGLDAAPGDVAEVRPAANALARALGMRLCQQDGAALFIDYGYFPSACGDTLQAVSRHRRHDVLADPGAADLTAHVDFAAFAAAARGAGARVFGPEPQGGFLAALGLAERATALLARATPAQVAALESGCRRLIHPDEMGTLFKALAVAAPDFSVPAGFAEEAAL